MAVNHANPPPTSSVQQVARKSIVLAPAGMTQDGPIVLLGGAGHVSGAIRCQFVPGADGLPSPGTVICMAVILLAPTIASLDVAQLVDSFTVPTALAMDENDPYTGGNDALSAPSNGGTGDTYTFSYTCAGAYFGMFCKLVTIDPGLDFRADISLHATTGG